LINSDSYVFVLFFGIVVSIELFKVVQGSSGVEALGASQRAHTNLVALTQLHVSSELFESLISVLIARVNNPSVGLHEHGGAQVVLRMPPVREASRLAAGA